MRSSAPSILTDAASPYCFLLRIPLRDLKPFSHPIDHLGSGDWASKGIRCHNWDAAVRIRSPVIGIHEICKRWCHSKRASLRRGCSPARCHSRPPCRRGNLAESRWLNLSLSIVGGYDLSLMGSHGAVCMSICRSVGRSVVLRTL